MMPLVESEQAQNATCFLNEDRQIDREESWVA